jgi:hypothetical protein
MLEKLRRKARIRPEKQGTFPSTWRVSRWGTDIGGDPTEALPYTLALWREETSDCRSEARLHSPESRRSPALGNSGFLQQWQRSAAGADENEFGPDIPVLAAFFVPDPHTPSIPITAQILHSMEKVD